MVRYTIVVLLLAALVVTSAGCSVNTKLVERERIDQEIGDGNQGYLFGTPPMVAQRRGSREYFEVQVEVPPVVKAENRVSSGADVGTELEAQGYAAPAIIGESASVSPDEEESVEPEAAPADYTSYTVQKGDTLQKISEKFYGTTRKWQNIFAANQDVLKGPDRVYPGQVLRIPGQTAEATQQSRYIK